MARHVPPAPPLPAWNETAVHAISKTAFAKDLEMTPAAISHWVTKGMPVRADGLIDLWVAAQWILKNLDSTRGHRARGEARAIQIWINALNQVRDSVRDTVEHAAAAAYATALATGLDAAAAARLADATAQGTVEGVNPLLVGEGNLPLPAPPAGLWRADDPVVAEEEDGDGEQPDGEAEASEMEEEAAA